jgi:hypothetical protein
MTSDNHESTGKPIDVASLTPEERRVLAVLAAVGGAWVTAEQLASLSEIDDARPVLAELERRGLVRKDERRRYAAVAGLGTRLRRALGVVDTADRVLRQLISIAEDGRLTLDDLDAVLGITAWAAEVGRLTELLQLVEAVQKTLSVTQRVEAWLQLVRRAKEAARELGDTQTEAWADEQLRVCERTVVLRTPIEPAPRPSGLRLGLATVALAGAALVGFVAASAVGAEAGPAGPTVTLPGQTVTTPGETITVRGSTATVGGEGETVTLPGSTVTEPGETVTEPGETVTEPGETVTEPGETVTEPGETVTLPGETVTLPQETVTLPGTVVTTTVYVSTGPR